LNRVRFSECGKMRCPKKIAEMGKEELLEKVVEILQDANYPLTGSEIARRLLIRYCGKDWYEQAGSHETF